MLSQLSGRKSNDDYRRSRNIGSHKASEGILSCILDIAKPSLRSYTNKLATRMDEEPTTEELVDLRIILIRFMADKEAHKKIPLLESRAPKLWDKVDRMYKYKQKENEDRS
jgi:hypothetical protein